MNESVNMQPAPAAESGLFTPDLWMVILTWVTFFLLLAVLYKFAWKPILGALDKREESIRRAVETADKVKEELTKINETRQQFLREAEEKARDIVSESKKAAYQISQVIQNKAKEEANILLENAQRDIKEETEKAKIVLRKESAQIAVELAGKLIEKNLDTDDNRKLIHRLTAKT